MKYQTLNANLSQFLSKDGITRYYIAEPVRFPNIVNQTYEREAVLELFQQTRTHIQNIPRLEQMGVNLRQSMQVVANQQLVQDLAHQILGGFTIAQILRGEHILDILDGANINRDALPLNQPDQIHFVLIQVHAQALYTAKSEVRGLVAGQARCPITRLVMVETQMQPIPVPRPLLRNMFIIAARNAVLTNAQEFADFQPSGRFWNGREPHYMDNNSNRSKTKDLIDILDSLSEEEIVEAENTLTRFLDRENVGLSLQDSETLANWEIHVNNKQIATPPEYLGATAAELRDAIVKIGKEEPVQANNHQNDSTYAVDVSIRESVKKLWKRYPVFAEDTAARTKATQEASTALNTVLTNLNPEVLFKSLKTQLLTWKVSKEIIAKQFPDITDNNYYETAEVKTLRQKKIAGYIDQLRPELKQQILQGIMNTTRLALKRAGDFVDNQVVQFYYGNTTAPDGILPIKDTLGLVWTAIHDRKSILNEHNNLIEDTPENKTKIDEAIRVREVNLFASIWEYQIGNLCPKGTYHKIVETLDKCHPDVLITSDEAQIIKSKILEFVKTGILRPRFEAHLQKAALLNAWNSETPSLEERALLRNFKKDIEQQMTNLFPAFLRKEFPDVRQEGQSSVPNLIQLVKKRLHEMDLVEQKRVVFVRKPVEVVTYEAQLAFNLKLKLPQAKAEENARKGVEINKLERKIDAVFVQLGVPIAKNAEEVGADLAARLARDLARELFAIDARNVVLRNDCVTNFLKTELAPTVGAHKCGEIIRQTIIALNAPEVPHQVRPPMQPMLAPALQPAGMMQPMLAPALVPAEDEFLDLADVDLEEQRLIMEDLARRHPAPRALPPRHEEQQQQQQPVLQQQEANRQRLLVEQRQQERQAARQLVDQQAALRLAQEREADRLAQEREAARRLALQQEEAARIARQQQEAARLVAQQQQQAQLLAQQQQALLLQQQQQAQQPLNADQLLAQLRALGLR